MINPRDIIRVCTVSQPSAKELDEAVNDAIQKGWVPWGPVRRGSRGTEKGIWYQQLLHLKNSDGEI